MANDVVRRVDADIMNTAAQPWGVGVYSDPTSLPCNGVPGADTHPLARLESVVLRGHPMQPRLLTIAGGVTALGDYPNDADGMARAGDVNRIRLSASQPNLNLAGLLVLCVDGACMGQFAYIVTHDTSTGWCTTFPEWIGAVPDATTEYVTLLPSWGRNQVHVLTEFEADFATAGGCTILVDSYTVGWNPPTSGKYAGQLGVLGSFTRPWRGSGSEFSVVNRDRTKHATTSGYRAGGLRTDECRGGLGNKFVLREAPASGRVVIAGATT